MTYVNYIQPAILGIGLAVALFVLLAGRTKETVVKFDQELQRTRLSKGAARRALGVIVAALVTVSSLAIVPAGTRGVVYSAAGGVSANERPEGFSFLIPLAQHVVPFNVRTQVWRTDKLGTRNGAAAPIEPTGAFVQSHDLQEITVYMSVNYHVDPSMAAELYQSVGPDFATTIIGPATFQLAKERIGLIEADAFASQRAALASDIRDALNKQVGGYGIVIEYVNIEDAIFDPAFILAVKNKVIADQVAAEQTRLIEAEAAKKQQAITQAEGRAASVLIEANAQAEANATIAASLTPDLLAYRRILQWNGALPTTYVGSGDALLLLQNQLAPQ